ncbi:hypothetical protein PC110_g23525 [Phytophthora cactorum]|uniref:Uncharacterized protein n=1 Tax=Phytophthora cactorum TaxID=29920 RepID=A0A329R6J8_9STRA|nr:hypothetical protein PC110_g23525 [Phytophthora cactorum]
MKDRADDEVNFYPTSKHCRRGLVDWPSRHTKNDIDSDGALDTGSWYYNAYQKYALLCLMEADISVVDDDTTLLASCVGAHH